MPPDGIAEGNDGNSPVDSSSFDGFKVEYPTAKAAQEEGLSPESQQKAQENKDRQQSHDVQLAYKDMELMGQATPLEQNSWGLGMRELTGQMIEGKNREERQRAAAQVGRRMVYGKVLADLSKPYFEKAAAQAESGQPMREAVAAQKTRIEQAIQQAQNIRDISEYAKAVNTNEWDRERNQIPPELFPLLQQLRFARDLLTNEGRDIYQAGVNHLARYFSTAEEIGADVGDFAETYNRTVLAMNAARVVIDAQYTDNEKYDEVPDVGHPLGLKLPQIPGFNDRIHPIQMSVTPAKGMHMYTLYSHQEHHGYLLFNPGEKHMPSGGDTEYRDTYTKDAATYMDESFAPVVATAKSLVETKQVIRTEQRLHSETDNPLDVTIAPNLKNYEKDPEVQAASRQSAEIAAAIQRINPYATSSEESNALMEQITQWGSMKEGGFLGIGKGKKKEAEKARIEGLVQAYTGGSYDIVTQGQEIARAMSIAAARDQIKARVAGLVDHEGRALSFLVAKSSPTYQVDNPQVVQSIQVPINNTHSDGVSKYHLPVEQIVMDYCVGKTSNVNNLLSELATREDRLLLPVAQILGDISRANAQLAGPIGEINRGVGYYGDTQKALGKMLKGIFVPIVGRAVDEINPDSLTSQGLDAVPEEIRNVLTEETARVKQQLTARKGA